MPSSNLICLPAVDEVRQMVEMELPKLIRDAVPEDTDVNISAEYLHALKNIT